MNDALRIVQSKMAHLNGEEKKLLQNFKEEVDTEDIEDANKELATEIKKRTTTTDS